MQRDPTERFSDRVSAYIRFRPSYPPQVYDLLVSECGLREDSVVADVGSGSGILSRILLERGHHVFGVEPNRAMCEAGESLLAGEVDFVSVPGSAEETGLNPGSIDMVIAAQSSHWFRREDARTEFARILKPRGWVVLVWNDRRKGSSPFLRAYENLLLAHGTDYRQVDHTRIGDAELDAFYGSEGCRSACFENRQLLDHEGLRGRLLSSSYSPSAKDPRSGPMLVELREIFEAHQVGGRVVFEYDTRVYYGRLSERSWPLTR